MKFLISLEFEEVEKILEALLACEEHEFIEKLQTNSEHTIAQQKQGLTWLQDFYHQRTSTQMKPDKKAKSFSDFELSQIIELFELQQNKKRLFEEVVSLNPTLWLRESLEMAQYKKLRTEKERSETLIAPLLNTIQKINKFSFAIFSGESIDVDAEKGLKGELDFVFSREAAVDYLEAPIFTLVEAKNAEITRSWGQAVAQMVGVQTFNQQKDKDIDRIYACVTSGEMWHFARLRQKVVTLDERPYSIYTELERILGIFQFIVNDFE